MVEGSRPNDEQEPSINFSDIAQQFAPRLPEHLASNLINRTQEPQPFHVGPRELHAVRLTYKTPTLGREPEDPFKPCRSTLSQGYYRQFLPGNPIQIKYFRNPNAQMRTVALLDQDHWVFLVKVMQEGNIFINSARGLLPDVRWGLYFPNWQNGQH